MIVTARLPKRAVLDELLSRTRPTLLLLDLDAQLVSRLARLRSQGVDITVRNAHDERAGVARTLPPRAKRVLMRGLRRVRRAHQTEPWAAAARRSWQTLTPPRPPAAGLPRAPKPSDPRAREVRRPDGRVAMRERRDERGRPYQRDYLHVDGTAYLTRWVERSTGIARGAIALSNGTVTRYGRIRSWHAAWLHDALPEHTAPIVGLGKVGAEAVTALTSRADRAIVLSASAQPPEDVVERTLFTFTDQPVDAVLRALKEVTT